MSKQSDLENIKGYLDALSKLGASTEAWGLQVLRLSSLGVLPCREIVRYNMAAIYTKDQIQKTLDQMTIATSADPAAAATFAKLGIKQAREPVLFGYAQGASGIQLNCPTSDDPPDPKQLRMFGTFSAYPCPPSDAPASQALGIAMLAPVAFPVALLLWTIILTVSAPLTLYMISRFMSREHRDEMEKAAMAATVSAKIMADTQICFDAKGGKGKATRGDWDVCNAQAQKNNPMPTWSKGFFASLGGFLITAGVVGVVGVATYYTAKHLSNKSADRRADRADRRLQENY